MGVFEEMRSLLQQEPSARRWARLCAWAMSAESAQFVDELLPYARHHLDRSWPDELRVADRAWLGRVLEGAPAPWLAMARRIQAGTLYDESSWQWTFDEGRELDAFVAPLGEERWTQLIEGGFLSGAVDLFVHEQDLGGGGARALLASDVIGRLGALSVKDHNDVVTELLHGLARGPERPRLTTLGLNGLDLDGLAMRELDAFAARSGLERLELRSSHSNGPEFQWPELMKSLRGLDLYESMLGDFLVELVKLPFANLESLNIGDAGVEGEVLRAMADASWSDQLITLDLSWSSGIDEDAFENLFDEGRMPALRRLDLMASSVSKSVLERILTGQSLPGLTHLELGIADDVTSFLFTDMDKPLCPSLHFLGLGTCSMSDVFEEIIEKGHWSNLRDLDVPNNDTEVAHVAWLLEAHEHLPRLERLGLGENELPGEGVVRAVSGLTLPALTHLDLRNNNIDDDAASALAELEVLTQLEVLDLRYNRITSDGVETLLASEHLAECDVRI